LGSLTLYIFAYFGWFILAMILIIFVYFTEEKYFKKKVYRRLTIGLFFNALISMTIEGFLDFFIYSVLNFKTLDTSTNGEILGLFISIISSFLTSAFLPTVFLWAIFTKD
jgi:hypothetical protein